MGQNQVDKNEDKKNDDSSDINKQIINIIKEKKVKKASPKKRTLISQKEKKTNEIDDFSGPFKDFSNDSDDDDDEIDKELNLKNVSDLIDLIYTKNINAQLKHRANKSVYETVFDIRNMIDNKEELNNNDYNQKSCKIMREIIEPDIFSIYQQNKEKKGPIKKNDSSDSLKNDEDIDKCYIENDFFKKWDYHDDIFSDEFEQIFENNEEEINEKINNSDIYDENENNESKHFDKKNETLNNDNTKKEKYLNNDSKQNKQNICNNNDYSEGDNDNYFVIHNQSNNNNEFSYEKNKNNKNNNTKNTKTNEFEIIENKDSFINSNIDSQFGINHNESSINFNPNTSKYYKDNENNDTLEIDNDSEKVILNISNASKNNITKEDYDYDEKDSSEKYYKQNNQKNTNNLINNKDKNKINFTYEKINNEKLDKHLNNNNTTRLYTKPKINDTMKNNMNKNNKNYSYNNKPSNNIINDNSSLYIKYNKNNEISNKKEKNIIPNNTNNDDNYNIDDYYLNSIHKSNSPIIIRERNRRVDNRNNIVSKDKDIEKNKEELPKIQLNKKNNYNNKIIPRNYISKTPLKEMQPKTYEKKRIDIDDIKITIQKVEEQIKKIEKLNLKNKKILNENNNLKNNINNNIKTVRNNIRNNNKISKMEGKKQRNITPLCNKRKNKKTKNNIPNKTYDEKNIKTYKEIMPIINLYKNKKYDNDYGINYCLNRAKTPEIKLKGKIKRKPKVPKNKNIYDLDRLNLPTNLREGFRSKPVWK